MNVQVRLFGPLAERVRCRTVKLTLESGATVADAIAEAKQSVPSLGSHLHRSIRVAVNSEYSDSERILREGDILALIPPVGGG